MSKVAELIAFLRQDPLLTVKDISELTKKSESTIYPWFHKGLTAELGKGGIRRVRLSELERFVATLEVKK
jgi:hypothetical protein